MTLTAYPSPGVGYDHTFFLQNDGNGWGNDYLHVDLDLLPSEFRPVSTAPECVVAKIYQGFWTYDNT